MSALSAPAEELLNTILDRCTAAGLIVGPMEIREWNVEAEVDNNKDRVKILVYFNSKGKLTPKVQGKKTPFRELVELQVHGDEPLESAFLKPTVRQWVGVDESGKGDYFGPLTAAGVLVTEDSLQQLKTVILRDSKEIGAAGITTAARRIREICDGAYSVVTVNPERYNEMMKEASFGKNSQRILAWMHARVIENLLEQHDDVKDAICDKFANESVIQRALMTKGRSITVHQHVRAEADPAVAAASILARDEFTRRMKQLEEKAGCKLPLGASNEHGILQSARHIVSTHGTEGLRAYAKLHFKTTEKMAGRLGSLDLF